MTTNILKGLFCAQTENLGRGESCFEEKGLKDTLVACL